MTIKLTISIPTWNRLSFLRENVLSIVHVLKTLPAGCVELLVSDNHSDDGTDLFLAALASEYAFVRYHRQSSNVGANANFYHVLKDARGEYVWLLGDDDAIVEDSVRKILSDLELYKPALMIGGTQNDTSGQRVYLPKIKTHLLTDQRILAEYDAIQLAGKMSVLIFSSRALHEVLASGWVMIQETKTPWPHLVWFLQILARGGSLVCLPYATNYFIEKNRYNLLQTGALRLNLLFMDYAQVVSWALPFFPRATQKALIQRLTKGRVDELVKILAYSTFLNSDRETLREAWRGLYLLPHISNKIMFLLMYALPSLIPQKIRAGLFHLPLLCSLRADHPYKKFICYLKKSAELNTMVGARGIYNKEDL